MNNGEKTAFPFHSETVHPEYGLTKREYFAAMAMQSLIALNHAGRQNNIGLPDGTDISEQAIFYADSLLKQLEK